MHISILGLVVLMYVWKKWFSETPALEREAQMRLDVLDAKKELIRIEEEEAAERRHQELVTSVVHSAFMHMRPPPLTREQIDKSLKAERDYTLEKVVAGEYSFQSRG